MVSIGTPNRRASFPRGDNGSVEPSPTPEPPPFAAEAESSGPSRGRTFGVAAALLLIGAGAVVGTLLVRSRDSTEPVTLKAGWSRQAGPGFTLGLPPGWRSFPTTIDADAFADFEKNDPARAAIVRAAFGESLSQFVRFIAFDIGTPVSESFVTNMQVLVLPAEGGLDRFIEVNAAQLASAEGIASTVERQRIVLPAGQAGILSAQLRLSGSTALAAVTQYVLVVEEVAFVMQFTTLADDLAALGPEFEDIARTFRFV